MANAIPSDPLTTLSSRERELIFGRSMTDAQPSPAPYVRSAGRGEAAIGLLGDFIFGRKPWPVNKAAQDAVEEEEIPEIEEPLPELIEDPDDETEEEKVARKRQERNDRDCRDLLNGRMPSRSTVDAVGNAARNPLPFFAGVSYKEGLAAYQDATASDARTPELPANHFFNGVSYHVGKELHDAYLAKRAGARRR